MKIAATRSSVSKLQQLFKIGCSHLLLIAAILADEKNIINIIVLISNGRDKMKMTDAQIEYYYLSLAPEF